MERKLIFFVGCLFLAYLNASPSPLPLPLPGQMENFSTGKSNNLTELKDIYAKCNESFKILPGQLIFDRFELHLNKTVTFYRVLS